MIDIFNYLIGSVWKAIVLLASIFVLFIVILFLSALIKGIINGDFNEKQR